MPLVFLGGSIDFYTMRDPENPKSNPPSSISASRHSKMPACGLQIGFTRFGVSGPRLRLKP